MRGWQKAIWMLLIGSFLLVELKAIRKDKIDYDSQQTQLRIEEAAHFSKIGQGIEQTIHQSQSQFNATMTSADNLISRTAALAKLSKENIDAVTGGETYCYLLAPVIEADKVLLIAHAEGKSPLHDVIRRPDRDGSYEENP